MQLSEWNNADSDMPIPYSLALWPIVTVVLVAAAIDIRTNRIPNWLVLPFLVAGLLASAFSRGWSGLGESLLGVVSASAILGVLCYLGGMGMGDLKLCASLGAWLGTTQVLAALLFTGIIGGAVAFCWAVIGGFGVAALTGVLELIRGFGQSGLKPHQRIVLTNPSIRRMPYAPAIAAGTILSLFGTR